MKNVRLCKQARGSNRVQELCESQGGRPGLPVLDTSYGFCGRIATLKKMTELRSGVEVELAVLGSPSLISLMASVGVEQH